MASSSRNLTLTEELEKLEQSITLTLQEIDHNFSKAHRIVTSGIIPAVEEYAKHSGNVWEGSKFWKQFFEASANVSLTGYEEVAPDPDGTQTETIVDHDTAVTTPSRHDDLDDTVTAEHTSTSQDFQDIDPSDFDSPAGVQSTPRIASIKGKRIVSPAPRRTSNANAKDNSVPTSARPPHRSTRRTSQDEPSTPRPQQISQNDDDLDSSPFEPLPFRNITTAQKTGPQEPLLHRILDKNYRVQATPLSRMNPWDTLSTRKPADTSSRTTGASAKKTPVGSAARTRSSVFDGDDSMLDSSPLNSPEMPTLSIRPDLLTRVRATPARATGPRTPGVSVQRPLYTSNAKGANYSAMFTQQQQQQGSSALKPRPTGNATPALWDSDSETEDDMTMTGHLRSRRGGPDLKTTSFDLEDVNSINQFVNRNSVFGANKSLVVGTGTSGARTAGLSASGAVGLGSGSAITGVGTQQSRLEKGPQTGTRAGLGTDNADGAMTAQQHKQPASHRLLQTPAREASRRIVQDLLSTATKTPTIPTMPGGAGRPGMTLEGDSFFDDDTEVAGFEDETPAKVSAAGAAGRGHVVDEDTVDFSPSIVRKAAMDDDDAF